jgi:neutral ceramidase
MILAETPYRAGFARRRLDAFDPSLCMLGWGARENVPASVAMPLHARAMVLEEARTGRRIAYVVSDLLMVSESVRRAVIARVRALPLRLGADDVALAATHTHSGPSGYSTYLLYALAAPGFSAAVHDAIVDAIVGAITDAAARLTPARLAWNVGDIPRAEGIVFNRAVSAYNRNRDVTPVSPERADEAVDRAMTVLRVDTLLGQPLGLVSWFALHGTSVHGDRTALHPDHKGEAARQVEATRRDEGSPDFVALFAQGAAGDVTPNHRWCARRGRTVGHTDDDFAEAERIGAVEARHALRLAAEARPLTGELDAALEHVDFFHAEVDPRFAFGRAGLRTAPPVLGLPFALGTREGPGPLAGVGAAIASLARGYGSLRTRGLRELSQGQGAKLPLVDLGRGGAGRFGAVIPVDLAPLRRAPDRFARFLGEALNEPQQRDAPWVPRHLPVQMLRVGPLAVALLPMEPTTVSGRRLARCVKQSMGAAVEHVAVDGYANAYAGYLTTPEEYGAQRYEAGATLFGEWSLPAWCTALDRLALRMKRDEAAHEGRRARTESYGLGGSGKSSLP